MRAYRDRPGLTRAGSVKRGADALVGWPGEATQDRPYRRTSKGPASQGHTWPELGATVIAQTPSCISGAGLVKAQVRK